MPERCAILGGYQTDFARNTAKEGVDIADLMAEAVAGTLRAAGIAASEIDVVHVGNAFGQLMTGQGHLGAMPATVEPGLAGVPASRHEAACASGGIALLAAMADLESGRYDTALVLGIEVERACGGTRAAELMAAAGWVGREAAGVQFMWPWAFDTIAATYAERFGLDEAHLHAIGELNLHNAKANPLAQTRAWAIGPIDDDLTNPYLQGRLRRYDCSQITDGAVGVVLASPRAARRLGHAELSVVAGWGHRTVGLPLAPKLSTTASAGAIEGDSRRAAGLVMPHVADTVTDAFGRAGVTDVWQLDAIETHDCFTPSEYLAIDHFGITPPGQSWRAIEDSTIERSGRLPINPSGGLIGVGHPVGATGVRMVLDAHRQVTGTAGDYQIPGAERVGTLNIGGSTATTVAFVLTGPELG